MKQINDYAAITRIWIYVVSFLVSRVFSYHLQYAIDYFFKYRVGWKSLISRDPIVYRITIQLRLTRNK